MKVFDNEYSGLKQDEVVQRIKENKINSIESETTKSYKEIFFHNIFTFFNLINIILFACVFLVGSYRNMLFILVVIFNTLTGIYQEIKAKLTLDKLAILNDNNIDVLRNNDIQEIPIDQIVLDDLLILINGDQIPADCILIEGQLEVNEALLTGESDAILKTKDDHLYSGSFVTSGKALCKVMHVGKDNYVHHIVEEAKKSKAKQSQLNIALNKILKIISIIIVPLAILLFAKEFFIGKELFEDAVVSTVAAVLGMIPSGLVLLTSIALTLSVVRLAKKQTLVQDLFCIETLARVDTICLDKTGTLTEGKMVVEEVVSLDNNVDIEKIIKNVNYNLEDQNVTSLALNEKFPKQKDYQPWFVVPFSSERKYSAISFKDFGTVYIGAYQFVFPNADEKLKELCFHYTKNGFRVLAIGYSKQILNESNALLDDLKCIGIVVLSDVIRTDAKDTLSYFKKQDTHIKIISGDDPITVSSIARRVGIDNYDKYIDATSLESDDDIFEAVQKYTIFGRVTPIQKKQMVLALQKHGHTVAMTGDGINDVLALKAADCSIAMASGSDAAKNAANIVLLNNHFNAMPHIVHEGRRVINNITASASMYLIKTIFSVLLTIGMILFGHGYPFEPIQLTVIGGCCVGIPTFFLTYEPNFNRVEGDFLKTVFRNAFPYALMIAVFATITVNCGRALGHDMKMLYTICVLLTSWCYYSGLKNIYSPLTTYRVAVIYTMQIVLYACFFIGHKFLNLGNIDYIGAIFLMFLITFSKAIYIIGFHLFDFIYDCIEKRKK